MSVATLGKSFDAVLELDKPRRLKIDFNTLCKAEEVTGLSFLAMEEEITGIRLRAIVWAGLQYEPKEERLTLDEVGLLVGEHFVEVTAAFEKAWMEAMPDPEDLEVDPNADPQETATAPS